ncbi:hypothetical protein E2C01_091556 [Portunus trituberculatus]|uniref:Uncharacterized protein n=1 Tax=Portunus trituberculatus TaxID=210409 RepID=A0A5B7JNW8_PORTR|nr:hypothetical protein [Portunus trituberculatus]
MQASGLTCCIFYKVWAFLDSKDKTKRTYEKKEESCNIFPTLVKEYRTDYMRMNSLFKEMRSCSSEPYEANRTSPTGNEDQNDIFN